MTMSNVYNASALAISVTSINELLANNAQLSQTFLELNNNNTNTSLQTSMCDAAQTQAAGKDQAAHDLIAAGGLIAGSIASFATLGAGEYLARSASSVSTEEPDTVNGPDSIEMQEIAAPGANPPADQGSSGSGKITGQAATQAEKSPGDAIREKFQYYSRSASDIVQGSANGAASYYTTKTGQDNANKTILEAIVGALNNNGQTYSSVLSLVSTSSQSTTSMRDQIAQAVVAAAAA